MTHWTQATIILRSVPTSADVLVGDILYLLPLMVGWQVVCWLPWLHHAGHAEKATKVESQTEKKCCRLNSVNTEKIGTRRVTGVFLPNPWTATQHSFVNFIFTERSKNIWILWWWYSKWAVISVTKDLLWGGRDPFGSCVVPVATLILVPNPRQLHCSAFEMWMLLYSWCAFPTEVSLTSCDSCHPP